MPRKSIIGIPLLVIIILWVCVPKPVSAQDATATPAAGTFTETVIVSSASITPLVDGIFLPAEGAVLSGVVNVSGTALSAWDLAFSYQNNPTGTWFVLFQSSGQVSDGVLVTWDTSAVTDGNYVLRLRVHTESGSQDFLVNVFVNNSSPTDVVTPVPLTTDAAESTQVLIITPLPSSEPEISPTPFISPTSPPPLPPNPAVLDPGNIFIYLGKGVLAVVVIFGLSGFIMSLRRK